MTANLLPGKMAQLVNAFLAGRVDEARALHHELYPLFTALVL